MKRLVPPLCLAFLLAAGPALAETRCGWIQNPTPGNWWLTDAQGEWTIGTQGGAQAEGMDLLPDFTAGEWVVTNGSSYGYGCACLEVTTERGNGQTITAIMDVDQLPLKRCTADSALPSPNN